MAPESADSAGDRFRRGKVCQMMIAVYSEVIRGGGVAEVSLEYDLFSDRR